MTVTAATGAPTTPGAPAAAWAPAAGGPAAPAALPPLPRATPEPDGSFSALVGRDWWSWSGAQGGLVAGLAAQAARRLTPPGQALRTITTHYSAPVGDAPLRLAATLERAGRSSASVLVRAEQGGRVPALALAGSLAGGASPKVADRPAPAAPRPEDCPDFSAAALLFACARQYEIRPATPALPLSGAAGSELTAWVRLRATDLVDTTAALVLADALAPALWARLTVPVPMPTVELTAHLVRDLETDPHTGWVLARQRNAVTGGGVSVDECDLWTPDGELLLQARQVRRVLGS